MKKKLQVAVLALVAGCFVMPATQEAKAFSVAGLLNGLNLGAVNQTIGAAFNNAIAPAIVNAVNTVNASPAIPAPVKNVANQAIGLGVGLLVRVLFGVQVN